MRFTRVNYIFRVSTLLTLRDTWGKTDEAKNVISYRHCFLTKFKVDNLFMGKKWDKNCHRILDYYLNILTVLSLFEKIRYRDSSWKKQDVIILLTEAW